VLQVLSRLTSPLACVLSSRRGPGRHDGYATTQLNLGEIPLLSRRPSPAISAATDVEEHVQQRAGEVQHGGQLLQPQQQQQQRLLVLEATDYSKDTGAVSACSSSSICDDQPSPVDAAADADENDGDDAIHE